MGKDDSLIYANSALLGHLNLLQHNVKRGFDEKYKELKEERKRLETEKNTLRNQEFVVRMRESAIVEDREKLNKERVEFENKIKIRDSAYKQKRINDSRKIIRLKLALKRERRISKQKEKKVLLENTKLHSELQLLRSEICKKIVNTITSSDYDSIEY